MVSEKEKNERGKTEAGQLLSLLRPAVKELADLHRSGKVHGAIGPESVVIRNHIWFCFPLPEGAAKAYTAEQKAFVSLSEPEKERDGQETGNAGEKGEIRESRPLFCIPPEQLFAGVPANPRTDVYSMCAVLYRKLTGAEPADARSRIIGTEVKKPSELGVRIIQRQEAALMKGLSMLVQERYANGEELYEGLFGEEKAEERTKKQPAREGAEETAGSQAREGANHTQRRKPGGALREGWKIADDIKEIKKLRSITFLDYIPSQAKGKWDVSEQRDGSVMAWLDKTGKGREERWDLYIGAKGGVKAAADSSWLFKNCENVEKISFGGNFDTFQTTDMSYMFVHCDSLSILDVRDFHTSQVTNMSWMFSFCFRLRRLDVSGFDTSHVTDMSRMFAHCGSLTSLDVSGFDTSQVTDMNRMFCGCSSLRNLDVRGFDTSQVTNMERMFFDCSSLENLDISGFDRSKAVNQEDMLWGVKGK